MAKAPRLGKGDAQEGGHIGDTKSYGQRDLLTGKPEELGAQTGDKIELARRTRTILFALQNEQAEAIRPIRPPHKEMTVKEMRAIVSTTPLARAFPVGKWVYFPLKEGEFVPVDMLRQGVFTDENGVERVLVLGQVTAHIGNANEVSDQASVVVSLKGFEDRLVNYRRLLIYGTIPETGIPIVAEPESSEPVVVPVITGDTAPMPAYIPASVSAAAEAADAGELGALIDELFNAPPNPLAPGGTVIMTPVVPSVPTRVTPPIEIALAEEEGNPDDAETQIMELPLATKILRLQQWLEKGKDLYIERYGQRIKIRAFEWPKTPITTTDEMIWVKYGQTEGGGYSRWSFTLKQLWEWNFRPSSESV